MSRVCRMQEHAQQKQQRQQQRKSVTLTAAVFFATLLFCSRPSVVQVSSFVVPTGAPPPRNSDYYSSRDSSSKRININAIQTAATPRATSPKLRALALPVAPKGKREAACASPTTHDEDTGEASVLPVPASPQPLRDNAFSIRGIFGRCALPVLFRRVCIGSMALARGQGRLGAQGSPESSHRRNNYIKEDTSFNSNASPTAATPLAKSSKLHAQELPAPRNRIAMAPPTTHDEKDTGAAGAPSVPLPQPPQDDTYSIRGRIREMRASAAVPKGVYRYDGIGKRTGGIWRSRLVGFVPSTVIAAQVATRWLIREEKKGTIVRIWPQSIANLFGKKSIVNVGTNPVWHKTVRDFLEQAMSTDVLVELQPLMDDVLDEYVARWEKAAETGKDLTMFYEISSFTAAIIITTFLGDYCKGDIFEKLRSLITTVAAGFVTIPRKFPWPLNKLPLLNYGTAMKARRELIGLLRVVTAERRADLARGSTKKAGLLDKMLAMQAEQMAQGGAKDGEYEFDDDFIYDNLLSMTFAGFDTTSASITQVVNHLATDEGRAILPELREEIKRSVTTGENAAHGGPGIYKEFPLLHAVVLEAYRLKPSVGSVLRKAVQNTEYNGYAVPAGELICWNLSHGNAAESNYPEPQKFCPFRFLHGDKRAAGDKSPAATTPNQIQPALFGFGKHYCPGHELAKLETVLFLKKFLGGFDYRLVEGQNTNGVLPLNMPKDGLKVLLTSRRKSTSAIEHEHTSSSDVQPAVPTPSLVPAGV